MATQTNSRVVEIGGVTVVCRELTVLEVRKWLEGCGDQSRIDVVGSFLFTDCTLDDIKRMTDLSDDRVDSLKPSQVQEVIAVCKELNPHFFVMLGKLSTVQVPQPTA